MKAAAAARMDVGGGGGGERWKVLASTLNLLEG